MESLSAPMALISMILEAELTKKAAAGTEEPYRGSARPRTPISIHILFNKKHPNCPETPVGKCFL
jgi:hypothetical protein